MARPAMFTNQQIAQKAQQLFLEKGIARTEMKQIAESCGISRMTLYRYFDSKESIAFTLAQSILEDFYQCTNAGGKGETGYEKTASACEAFVQYMIQHPSEIRLLDDFDCYFSDQYPITETAKNYTEYNKQQKSPLSNHLREGIEDQSVRPDIKPIFHAQFMVNTLMGVAQRVLPRLEVLYNEQGYGTEYLTEALALLLRDISTQK